MQKDIRDLPRDIDLAKVTTEHWLVDSFESASEERLCKEAFRRKHSHSPKTWRGRPQPMVFSWFSDVVALDHT